MPAAGRCVAGAPQLLRVHAAPERVDVAAVGGHGARCGAQRAHGQFLHRRPVAATGGRVVQPAAVGAAEQHHHPRGRGHRRWLPLHGPAQADRRGPAPPGLVDGGPERPVAAGEERVDHTAGAAHRPGRLPGGPAVALAATAATPTAATAAAAELDVEVVLVDVDLVAAVALVDVAVGLVDPLVVCPVAGRDVGVAGVGEAVPQRVVDHVRRGYGVGVLAGQVTDAV